MCVCTLAPVGPALEHEALLGAEHQIGFRSASCSDGGLPLSVMTWENAPWIGKIPIQAYFS